jgi:predicted dehydrogenase
MKFLVVGAGSIGRRHAQNLMTLDAGDVAVCDTDADAVAAATSTLGVKGYGALAEALAAGPDAVIVSTPTHRHLEVACAALEANAHVLVEKPVALSSDSVLALAELAAARERTARVACNMRFHPGVSALRAALESGAAGRVRVIRAWFSHYLPNWRPYRDYRQTYSARRAEGGGILLEGVHEIDYVRWLGGEIEAIDAWAARLSALEIDAEDTASLRLRLAGGVAGLVDLDALGVVKRRGAEIVGDEAVLRWTSDGKAPEIVTVTRETARVREVLLEIDSYDGNLMYLEQLRAFLAVTRGEAAPLATVQDATRALEVALQARAIAESRA